MVDDGGMDHAADGTVAEWIMQGNKPN